MRISGSKLMKARQAADQTRQELGSIIGVTSTRIGQLEKDGCHNVKPIVMSAIAKFLKVKQEELQ